VRLPAITALACATALTLQAGTTADDSLVITSKVKKITLSGVHYVGYRYTDTKTTDGSGKFETRRNYLQTKAYFTDKDFFRLTFDTYEEDSDSGTDGQGSYNFRLKYAYLYLDNILPHTGVEFGIAHRPWIDYEEHNGWWYRSIQKVFLEAKEGAHLINSADGGVNLKTKLEYFSSEVGLFNGEGYHGNHKSDGEGGGFNNSFEARATWHVLGGGTSKSKPMKQQYFNLSALYINSQDDDNVVDGGENVDRTFEVAGIHGVYNQPEFLVALMVAQNRDEKRYDVTKGKEYDYTHQGYSLNAEYRVNNKLTFLGRYDRWFFDKKKPLAEHARHSILGTSYKYNKNVKWIVSTHQYENCDGKGYEDGREVLISAEVKW